MLDADEMAAKLKLADAKGDVSRWVAAEIQGHLAAATNRPMSLSFTNIPVWTRSVYGYFDRYDIEYEVNRQNDHVSFWSWSGMAGGWGVLLGGPEFEPDTNRLSPSLFYVVKSSPGFYTWHSGPP